MQVIWTKIDKNVTPCFYSGPLPRLIYVYVTAFSNPPAYSGLKSNSEDSTKMIFTFLDKNLLWHIV